MVEIIGLLSFITEDLADEYPEWASIRATYHENPRLSEQDILEARKEYVGGRIQSRI